MKPKKDIVALVVGKVKKERGYESKAPAEEEDMEEPEVGLQTCAEEMISAFESKDADALSEALKAFIDEYSARGDSSSDEE